MNANRKTGIVVGVLFIAALVFNLLASSIMDPILSVPEYLSLAHPNRYQIIIGNLLNIAAALAMMFIPISLFYVVREQERNILLGYVVFRSLEGILFIYMAIRTLALIDLSKAYLDQGAQHLYYIQVLGDSLRIRSALGHADLYCYVHMWRSGVLFLVIQVKAVAPASICMGSSGNPADVYRCGVRYVQPGRF